MKSPSQLSLRGLLGAALAWALGALPSPALAQELSLEISTSVVSVEEDWELVLTEPDWFVSAPQVATQMNPVATNSEFFTVFCLNFQEQPYFEEGGIQVQLWEGNYNTHNRGLDRQKLSVASETITWTQWLAVQNGKLQFGVKNGSSESYGSFGGGLFKVSSSTDGWTNLNSYDASTSASNSGISFGSNRVASLRIVQVRKYLATGVTLTVNEPLDVYVAATTESTQ